MTDVATQEAMEARFVQLVEESWDIQNEFLYAQSIDEQITGAVVSALVHQGYSLIDLTSDGTHHYLRFENLATRKRMAFRLHHMTGKLESAKAIGHLANVTIGVGLPLENTETIWDSLKQSIKSSLATEEPGVMTLDADIMSKYLYAQVMLIWKLDEYFLGPWQPDYKKLVSDIQATSASLEKYLNGRLSIGSAS